MKNFVYIFLFSLLVYSSCDKQPGPDYQKATITGYDYRMCICCGGWFIEIGKETYRFDQLPPSSNLDLNNAEFPLKVKVIWKKDENGCAGDEIIIEKIKKR